MSARLAEVARQTVLIAEADRYINPAGQPVEVATQVRAAIEGTRHYTPEQPVEPIGPRAVARIEVTRESTMVVAGAFAEALRVVDHFDQVIFAVYDNLPRTPVHAAFARVFAA